MIMLLLPTRSSSVDQPVPVYSNPTDYKSPNQLRKMNPLKILTVLALLGTGSTVEAKRPRGSKSLPVLYTQPADLRQAPCWHYKECMERCQSGSFYIASGSDMNVYLVCW